LSNTISRQLVLNSAVENGDDVRAAGNVVTDVRVGVVQIRCSTCDGFVEFADSGVALVTQCPSCGTVVDPDHDGAADLEPRRRVLSHFELLEQIGGGQYGDVWRAHDLDLNRIVAVKIPRISELDHETLSLFLREARTAAGLKHPNIVPVHEVGREGGTAYIVSDFISGETLAARLKEHKPTPGEAALLCWKIAGALQHAHEKGIIHRDVKPGNIMIDDRGEPHVMDFGLAKWDGSESTIAIEGEILGTASYMPPEQARGDACQADARSDVYSLGIILYEMLAGGRPFRGEMSLVLHKVLTQEPPAPRSIDGDIPRDLETVCLKAITKEPAGRYQTAAEMAGDLRRFLRGEPVLASRPGPLRQLGRLVRRNKMVAGLAIVTFAALAALGLTFAFRPGDSAPSPEQNPVAAGTVVLDTLPSGADVYFVRLDDRTGRPDPRRFISAGKSPVQFVLPKGDYLVVAVKGDLFHEVYRRTPGTAVVEKGRYPHNSWKYDKGGAIRLGSIRLFRNDIADVDQMCRLEGSPRFVVGQSGSKPWPLHLQRIAPFFVDPQEVAVQNFEQRLGELRNRHGCTAIGGGRPNDPVTCVTWDQAVQYAELVGKRLPTEEEFEFAATNGGKQAFPWSNSAVRSGHWEFGRVRQPAYDELTVNRKRIYGLYSNVAEWTMSWYVPYPGGKLLREHDSTKRVVRGGPPSVAEGTPNPDEAKLGPRQRFGIFWVKARSKLGFRCVRSIVPRTRPADFEPVPSSR
jgi:eukaryotic-like serine/threonine-protein kinase